MSTHPIHDGAWFYSAVDSQPGEHRVIVSNTVHTVRIETRPALLYIIRKRTFGGGGGFPRLPRTAIPRLAALAAASSPRADLPLATQLDPLARGAGRRAVHEAGLDVARDRVEGLLHVDRVLGGGLEET